MKFYSPPCRSLAGRFAKSGVAENGDARVFCLGDFLDDVQLRAFEGPYIVAVTGHYYAVDGDKVCDTATKIPMEIHTFKCRPPSLGAALRGNSRGWTPALFAPSHPIASSAHSKIDVGSATILQMRH